jgi:hypothetical protein
VLYECELLVLMVARVFFLVCEMEHFEFLTWSFSYLLFYISKFCVLEFCL